MRNPSTHTAASRRGSSASASPSRRSRKSQRSQARRLHASVNDVKRDVRELGHAATGAAREQVENVRDTAANYVDQGRDKIKDLEASLETRLREQPLKSMLVAGGIGFVLGLFLRR